MILLFGSDTLVGEEALSLIGRVHKVHPLYNDFNFRDGSILEKIVEEFKPEKIINCHEYGDIVNAESDRGGAYDINGLQLKQIGDICRVKGILLIHLSTSYIFDGQKHLPYKEDDKPNPISVYGDSKLLGELKIIESGCSHLIIRLPDLYAYRDSFLQKIFNRAVKFNNINVIMGQYLSPTSASDASLGIFELLNRGAEGTYNYCSSGNPTAREFVDYAMGVYNTYVKEPARYKVTELAYREFPITADRPIFNVLDNSKYENYTGIKIMDWKISFNEYFKIIGEKL